MPACHPGKFLASQVLITLLAGGAGNPAAGSGREPKAPSKAPSEAAASATPPRYKLVQGVPVGPGADLQMQDFTGAVFGRVDCTGARTRGACFFDADVREAIGLDLGSARVHPFFLALPGKGARPYQFLNIEGPEGQFPRSLVAGAGGLLFCLNGTDPLVRCFHPSGAHREGLPWGNTQMLALAKDTQDRLWGFGDRILFNLAIDALRAPLAAEPPRTLTAPGLFTAPPRWVTAGPDGKIMVGLADRLLRIQRVETKGLERIATVSGPPDAEDPARLTHAFGTRFWVTRSGLAEAGLQDLMTGQATLFDLPWVPHGVACDADGHLWFTEGSQGNRIGRLRPEDGAVAQVELPPGIHPLEIVACQEKLFFTVENMHLLGAVWRPLVGFPAPPAPPAGAAEAKEQPDAAAPERQQAAEPPEAAAAPAASMNPGVAGPASPTRSRAQKKRAAWRAKQKLGARATPPAAGTEGERADQEERKGGPEPQPGPALRWQEGTARPVAPSPAPAADPAARLARLGVTFPAHRQAHALDEHGADAPVGKSRFAEPFRTPERLLDLVAQGLKEAEGTFGRVIVRDIRGRYLTLCRHPSVIGEYLQASGEWRRTCHFLVVTASADGIRHTVLTAYPVKPTW